MSIILLAGSVAVTVILFLLQVPFFFLFLFIPIIPLFGKREVRKCPICGYETSGNERFCPFDGTELPGPTI